MDWQREVSSRRMAEPGFEPAIFCVIKHSTMAVAGPNFRTEDYITDVLQQRRIDI